MFNAMPVEGIVPDSAAETPADLVIRNGRVHTQDPARPAAAALAVREGRIVAVGDDQDMAPFVGTRTRIVDALNRRIIPGLNDSHLHVIRGGLNYLLELHWDGVPSLRMALWMLREQAGRTPQGQWVRVVGGWTGEQFAERRLPTVSELDAAAPDTPSSSCTCTSRRSSTGRPCGPSGSPRTASPRRAARSSATTPVSPRACCSPRPPPRSCTPRWPRARNWPRTSSSARPATSCTSSTGSA
nr:amidohydrolase family protein [Nonomuraea aridisoli]